MPKRGVPPGEPARAKSLVVAGVAMRCDEDPAANRAAMAALVRAIKAERPETRLVLFPELSLGWFWHGERRGRPYDEVTAESLEYHRRIAEPIPGPTTKFVGRLAREHGVYIAFGMGEHAEPKPYNALVLVDPSGTVVAKRRQRHLACDMFQASDEPATAADVNGVRVALLICSDAQSGAVRRAVRRARPDVVLHALAAPQKDATVTRALAALFSAWVVTSNHVGGEPEPASRYPGLLVAVDAYGRLVHAQIGEEGAFAVEAPTAATSGGLGAAARRVRAGLALVALVPRLLWEGARTKLPFRG